MPEVKQVNAFLVVMGPRAHDILTSFKLSATDLKKYEAVKEAFDKHYTPRKTKMCRRCTFNSRIQGPEESVDTFITDLHTIARRCEYGAIQDELVRDRIVCGIENKTHSAQIQNMGSEPLLDTVTNRVRHLNWWLPTNIYCDNSKQWKFSRLKERRTRNLLEKSTPAKMMHQATQRPTILKRSVLSLQNNLYVLRGQIP